MLLLAQIIGALLGASVFMLLTKAVWFAHPLLMLVVTAGVCALTVGQAYLGLRK